MSGRRNEAFPQSGVPGIHWDQKRGKWSVRFKTDGCEIYLGLYADLDEGKCVLAAARLEHNPKARSRDDSTAHLTDAEIAERFALDDEGDPVWWEKPLKGSETDIREAARWNMRRGARKLDERARLLRDGPSKLIWRRDIIQRLVAIAETQGPGIPRAGDAASKAAAPDCDSREAVAIAESWGGGAETDGASAPRDDEILPPEPIGKGALARVIVAAARSIGTRLDEFTVMSSGKDPYRLARMLGPEGGGRRYG